MIDLRRGEVDRFFMPDDATMTTISTDWRHHVVAGTWEASIYAWNIDEEEPSKSVKIYQSDKPSVRVSDWCRPDPMTQKLFEYIPGPGTLRKHFDVPKNERCSEPKVKRALLRPPPPNMFLIENGSISRNDRIELRESIIWRSMASISRSSNISELTSSYSIWRDRRWSSHRHTQTRANIQTHARRTHAESHTHTEKIAFILHIASIILPLLNGCTVPEIERVTSHLDASSD